MKLKTGINIQLDFLEFVSPPISYKFNTLFYMYHIVFLMLKVEHVIFSGISFLMEGGGWIFVFILSSPLLCFYSMQTL